MARRGPHHIMIEEINYFYLMGGQTMKLIWHGHSCFELGTEAWTVVVDPYRVDAVPGYAPLRLTADTVYCSHEHRDHAGREQVSLTGREPAVQVEELHTFHDDQQGALRGESIIHIFSAEGLRVAHMGDLGCQLEPEQMEALRGLDAMLIPVGGYYTIDAAQADALVEELKPRVVIPMHYRTEKFGYDVIGLLNEFLALRKDAVYYNANTLELSADTPAQTAILAYQG